MTEEQWPGPDDDPLDISSYDEVRQRHIVGLGLIAEYSSQVDEIARWLLHMAIGTVTLEQTTALFLGDRFGTVEVRYQALLARDPKNEHLQAGAAWLASTKKLVEKRDALIHRPVQADFVEGRSRHLLMPARRKQQVEDLANQATQLVVGLANAFEDGYSVAVRHRQALGLSPAASVADGAD